MAQDTIAEQCTDPTQTITIDIPCGLAERAEKYAKERGNTLSNLVIEALDAFLRGGNAR